LATDVNDRDPRPASGLLNTTQEVGGTLGLAILAMVANGCTKDLLHAGGHDGAYALTKGYERVFLAGTGSALVGCLLAIVLISSRDSRAHSQAARGAQSATASSPAG
jgi:hypothetical protein